METSVSWYANESCGYSNSIPGGSLRIGGHGGRICVDEFEGTVERGDIASEDGRRRGGSDEDVGSRGRGRSDFLGAISSCTLSRPPCAANMLVKTGVCLWQPDRVNTCDGCRKQTPPARLLLLSTCISVCFVLLFLCSPNGCAYFPCSRLFVFL